MTAATLNEPGTSRDWKSGERTAEILGERGHSPKGHGRTVRICCRSGSKTTGRFQPELRIDMGDGAEFPVLVRGGKCSLHGLDGGEATGADRLCQIRCV